MTRTAAARRPGLSLLEVIVALFVMALGMISLLTLFPLGAIQMGQALRDARAAETCSQADTHMRLWWQRDVVEPTTLTAKDPAFQALDWPPAVVDTLTHPFVTAVPPVPALTDTDLSASYPLLIDPIGSQAYPTSRKVRIAGNAATATFPRRTMNWIGTSAAFSFRAASMMDDITFDQNGVPDTTASGIGVPVVRQGRYNWAAVVQRPANANRYVADLKILVFDSRAPGIGPADAELILNPTGNLGVGATQVVLSPVSTSPDYLRAGNWILDGTLDPTTGRRNAVWYRIQALDRDTIPGKFILDLQTPLLRPITPPPSGAVTTPASQFYVFKGLIEVFDRPQLAPADYKQQVP